MTVSEIGHAEWGNIQACFAAWRNSAMAITISALESARGVLWRGRSLKRSRCGYRKLWSVPLENMSSKLGRKRRLRGEAVFESVIGWSTRLHKRTRARGGEVTKGECTRRTGTSCSREKQGGGDEQGGVGSRAMGRRRDKLGRKRKRGGKEDGHQRRVEERGRRGSTRSEKSKRD